MTTALLANYTFGRLRMPFQSDVYEMLQAPFLMPAIASVVRTPRKPTFKVTPKGGAAEGDYVSEHIWPVAGLTGVILATQLFGMYRFVTYPAEQQHLTIVMIWNLLNLLAALTALAAMFERGRPPEADVLPLNKEAMLVAARRRGQGDDRQIGPALRPYPGRARGRQAPHLQGCDRAAGSSCRAPTRPR